MEKLKKLRKVIIIGVILIFIIILIDASVTSVPSGFVGIRTRFGKVQDSVIHEGINLKIPFIEKIYKMDCRIKKLENNGSAASKDLQDVTISVAINYSVEQQNAYQLYRNVGMNYESILVAPAITESVKATTALYTAEELITKRAEVSNAMKETLITKISDLGFEIVEFNVMNLNFSDSYSQAIEQKQVAEQDAKKAEYELQKAKIENEKKIAEAEANAKVIEAQNSQITENYLKLKELEIQEQSVNRWNGVLPSTMTGETIPFLTVNE